MLYEIYKIIKGFPQLVSNLINKKKGKIFVIGLNKTGTTSIDKLFTSLGLLSYHGTRWRACTNKTLLHAYDCFSDGPPESVEKLDNMFPESKFILQVRELDEWIYSRLAHVERDKKERTFKPTLAWDTTEQAVISWIKQRNAHHLAVLSYFSDRRSDLLIINFIRDETAATQIARFLGYSGRFKRPKSNVNPDKNYPPEHKEMLEVCINRLGLAEDELRYDILCPSLLDKDVREQFPVDTKWLQTSSL